MWKWLLAIIAVFAAWFLFFRKTPAVTAAEVAAGPTAVETTQPGTGAAKSGQPGAVSEAHTTTEISNPGAAKPQPSNVAAPTGGVNTPSGAITSPPILSDAFARYGQTTLDAQMGLWQVFYLFNKGGLARIKGMDCYIYPEGGQRIAATSNDNKRFSPAHPYELAAGDKTMCSFHSVGTLSPGVSYVTEVCVTSQAGQQWFSTVLTIYPSTLNPNL